jgi:hypothetical protein
LNNPVIAPPRKLSTASPARLPIERVADPENRLLDAEEASGRAAPPVAKPRAKTARLERMLLDRAG